MAQSPSGVAIPTSPLVDEMGNIRPEWRSFFTSLYLRSGGSTGTAPGTAALTAALALERTTRVTADAALTDQITAESTARQAADNSDTQNWHTAVSYEAMLRQNADALLVPRAQLCTLWAACDLTFLPHADPGGGKPWLDGPHIAVGAVTTVGIALEDGSGDWELADGTGHILYG